MSLAQPERRERETTVQEMLAEFDRMSGGLGGYTQSRPAWDAAATFLRWCKANGVDQPLLFMWLRFRVVRSGRGTHGARPSLQNMASPALLKRYFAIVERQQFEGEMKKQFDTQHERSLVSVNAGHEAVRRDYVINGRTDLCEVQQGISGGYHPFSKWCPACPRAATCAQRLNAEEGFDVVALRLGRMTVEEAAAKRRHRV